MFAVIMTISVIGAVLFGAIGYADTTRIVDKLYEQKQWQTTAVIAALEASNTSAMGRVYAALELDTLDARNERAAAQLATRTWQRFLTSLFGSILIVFGAAFVLGKITIENSELGGSGGGVTASLKTTSPGIILATLGVVLMSQPLWSSQEIRTSDGAAFGTFILTDGADGATVSVGPRTITAAAPPAAELSDDDIRKLLAEPAAAAAEGDGK